MQRRLMKRLSEGVNKLVEFFRAWVGKHNTSFTGTKQICYYFELKPRDLLCLLSLEECLSLFDGR